MNPSAVSPLQVLTALSSLSALVVLVVIAARWSGKFEEKAGALQQTLDQHMAKIETRLDAQARRLDNHESQISYLRGLEDGRKAERERRSGS